MYKSDAIVIALSAIGMLFAAKTCWYGWKRRTCETVVNLAVTLTLVFFIFSMMNHDPKIGSYDVKPSIYPECAMYTDVTQKDNCESVVQQQHQNDLNPAPTTTIYFG